MGMDFRLLRCVDEDAASARFLASRENDGGIPEASRVAFEKTNAAPFRDNAVISYALAA